ncbi:transmembrane protein 140 [Microcaecilia unicolor]|uniref:Transmembrane protein 140 n=1 Tax=Microcaecilia unicolor TaxID=1415580 RepID=A0A6P7Z7E3_9AMPH|nr:transmembrane protein 140 [Microcaecilia unicolor]XP_030071316.1 transmembrane protein 140 [Microcaecilia unicolor]
MKMGSRMHYLVCLVLLVLALGLLLCTLMPKAGNIVDTERKRISFNSLCFWNETGQELTCYEMQDLQRLGIALQYMILVGSACVYVTLPLCLFALFSFVLARSISDRDVWQFGVWLVALSVVALSVGIGTFLAAIWASIHRVELNNTVVGLVVVYATLLLQVFLAKSYKWESEQVLTKPEYV